MGKINTKRDLIAVFILILLVTLLTNSVTARRNNINLNFKSVKLKDAFRALADIANMNVVTDSSVKGTTTVHLQNISFREAVDLLAKSSGLDYRIVNNTILVAEHGKLEQGFGQKITKIFKLKNSKPTEVKKSVNYLLESKEALRVDKRTNSLIVTTYQSKIPEIKNVIEQLDEEKEQIIIQARIEEISRSGLQNLGINWEFGNLTFDNDSAGESSNTIEIGSTTLGYTSVLNLLEKNGNATVLANPQITTIDGKQANIDIGESVPIVEKADEETNVSFKDVGISLDIKPRITDNNKVAMDVTPEVSVVSEYFETSDGARYPVIDTRKAQTNVRVSSGDTIAIGGLIKEEEYENLSKVPFLGDVPVLGKLFREKTVDSQKVELVIFITPKIVDETKVKREKKDIREFNYKIKKSDSLWGISKLFDISFARLLDYNDIQFVKDVTPGELIKVPVPKNRYYKVKSEDKLLKLAEKYKISIERIKRINDIKTLENKVGQKIILPAAVK